MVSRCKYQSSSEIGAYVRMTNSYVLIPTTSSDNFSNIFEDNISGRIPILRSNIAGTAIVGRLSVGNKYGLLVPLTTTDSEIKSIKENLPDNVEIKRIQERFSALGNVISCNDHIALVHPELDPDTIQEIQDILKVEAIPTLIGGEPLVGSYSLFTNRGGIVSSKTTIEEIDELSSQLGISIETATVNRGSNLVSAGVAGNDFSLFCGWDTTALEIANLTRIFKVDDHSNITTDIVNIDESILDIII